MHISRPGDIVTQRMLICKYLRSYIEPGLITNGWYIKLKLKVA